MSAPTDPIEGYYAQQKAPTARELLVRMRDSEGLTKRNRLDWTDQLTARVDALIARAEYLSKHGAAGPFVEEVLRLLNGKQP